MEIKRKEIEKTENPTWAGSCDARPICISPTCHYLSRMPFPVTAAWTLPGRILTCSREVTELGRCAMGPIRRSTFSSTWDRPATTGSRGPFACESACSCVPGHCRVGPSVRRRPRLSRRVATTGGILNPVNCAWSHRDSWGRFGTRLLGCGLRPCRPLSKVYKSSSTVVVPSPCLQGSSVGAGIEGNPRVRKIGGALLVEGLRLVVVNLHEA